MKRMLLSALPVLFVIAIVSLICRMNLSDTAVTINPSPVSLSDILKPHRGRVLILLLGQDGCPGTAKTTTALDEYVHTKPDMVSVVRLDVPLPGKFLSPSAEWKHAFPRLTDTRRAIANELDFFYYPTLYIFDRQGEKRYVGGYDKDKLIVMVREILAEKPGRAKKIYTLPIPSVGELAPPFAGKTLTGDTIDLKSSIGKRGLLIFFSRTSCPFSVGELPRFKELADHFHGEGVNAVIVNQEEELDSIRLVYEKQTPGITIMWDSNGDISKSFGVDAVPFYFLLDGNGKIVNRRSFTHTAASNAVNTMLGHEAKKSRFKPTEGG